jgi:diguanylate cyclase (GGDEF)-like protein
VRTFDEEDLRLLETVAAHASVALENSRLVDRLRHEAMHDGLTGLPNRGFLHRAGDDALAAVAEGEADGCALMVMDLDGFKQVNDTLGHLHGDLLLREVANRLLDAVPSGAVVARLGGDEFAVLLPDCDSESVALATAGRVLASLERPARVDDLELEVGASIGLALAPQHGTEMGVLLKRADAAMYSAKGSGRGTCTFADDLEEGGRTRLVLASELRQGLLRGELVVHGQPQAELGSGRVTGVEVLVRWQHPSRGLLYPDDFLPVAERAGLLRPLTQQVLEAGVRACATWSAAGHDLVVAVNLSARTLHDPSLVDDVLRLLDEHAVPAARLTLEITENSVMSDLAGTTEVLERLRAAGVRVSVDDFGTGYSSLSYLSRLPVDEVKVDKHFVLGMSRDAHDAAIVRSVIDLGANLGLAVVAEGVEDARTWATLADLGCTTGQGFWLAPGMGLYDLLPWLEARAAGGPRTPVRRRRPVPGACSLPLARPPL